MTWQTDISPPGNKHYETVRMVERMERFIQLRAAGITVVKACHEVGITLKSYEKWRKIHPPFRVAVDSMVNSRKDLADDPLQRNDFARFRLKYFQHFSPPFHMKIIDRLENSKPGSITMILVPPDHGKTTLLTDWICSKLAYDPNHRILYITESSGLSTKVLGRIKRRMTDVAVAPQYIADFGPFYQPGQERSSKPWANQFITVFQSTHDEQDYSLESMGWVSQIYGTRSDTIVLDDYQTLKTAEKGNITPAMVDKFQQDIYTRIDPAQGRIVIIGTRVAQIDFYLELLNQGDVVDDVITMTALNHRGEPLWPERLPLERLDVIKKKVGSKVWKRAYMMAPQDEGAATFTEKVLNDCKNASIKIADPLELNEEAWAGVDPAIDKYTAISAAAISPQHFRLMTSEHYYELATGEAILSQIFNCWVRTKFTKLMVEAVSFQKALARDERLEKMRKECGFEIVEHVTGMNKLDETFGVARMASSFIDETIIIPWADQEAADMFGTLIAELLQWRATIPTRLRTQDLIMSIWFMWVRWQQFRKDSEHETRVIRTSGMPFKPTSYKPGLFQHGRSFF